MINLIHNHRENILNLQQKLDKAVVIVSSITIAYELYELITSGPSLTNCTLLGCSVIQLPAVKDKISSIVYNQLFKKDQ